jgi:hypothetical protein
VLQALSPDIDENLAQTIIQQRAVAPFKLIGELQLIPSFPPAAFNAIKNYITTAPDSRYYIITSTGVVNGIERRVQEEIQTQGAQGNATVILRQEP